MLVSSYSLFELNPDCTPRHPPPPFSLLILTPELLHLFKQETRRRKPRGWPPNTSRVVLVAVPPAAPWPCARATPQEPSLSHQGDSPPCHLLPRPRCPLLQPIHMQLAADNDWMVLHVVWASMKETGSYRSGRQQGWLLTLRAVRRGSEPFSNSAFSARS